VKRSVLIVSEENLVYNIERVPDVKALAFGQLLTSDFQLFSIILGAVITLVWISQTFGPGTLCCWRHFRIHCRPLPSYAQLFLCP